jgi:hypothetical protein
MKIRSFAWTSSRRLVVSSVSKPERLRKDGGGLRTRSSSLTVWIKRCNVSQLVGLPCLRGSLLSVPGASVEQARQPPHAPRPRTR